MNTQVLYALVALSTLLSCSESAKILGMFPLAGKSLNILYNRLMTGIANAGHDVTVISAFKFKDKITKGSLRHILLTGFMEEHEELMVAMDTWNIQEESNMFQSKEYIDLTNEIWNRSFNIPEVKKLLHSNETFDAVIMEDVWTDCFKILSKIFDCPLIVFTSIGGNNPIINAAIGNPLPPSYVPHYYLTGPNFNGMNFFRRVQNCITYVVDNLIYKFYLFPAHNRILQSNFKNPPDVATFYNNISLVLLGSHSSFRQAAPLMPNVIEIGGFHIDPPQTLPKDLQDFLDEATEGAIYFSLGSHVNGKDLPLATRNAFLETFRKLKQKVIWKFEEDLPGKPNNVLIKKWLPQRDILAHPNIKLFITHGGHGSILETIYHGVPCLMLPVFFDQFNNVYQAVEKGFALKLNYRDADELVLKNMITELLENPKYTSNAKKLQSIFHDRPMKPLDTAIYWIEYVIRHKGANHLKVIGRNMPWYQFYSVDVIVFLLASSCVVLYFSYLILFTLLCQKKQKIKQKIN